MRARLLSVFVLVPLLGACATKADLRDLRTEMGAMRATQETLMQQMSMLMDSISTKDVRLRGDLMNRLLQMERQLVQIQELTGQGQQRLAEMREDLRRQEEAMRAPVFSGGAGMGMETGGDAEELYAAAEGALMRGSFSSARTGFEALVQQFPQHVRAPQALLGIGETYEKSAELDQALAAYLQLVESYPDAPQAPTAMLRAGRLEAGRDNEDEARTIFNQLIVAYPDSPEAGTAREELDDLGG